ncbi:hypothetical protein HGRIS_013808 [Hohenbuehelia grisea]|uniref:Helicase C-terminal domain-containing protein n=1 Tax=Hohenbuehelia grisea TaxID=104357 RepID=A0ABR3IWR7_9AGAR
MLSLSSVCLRCRHLLLDRGHPDQWLSRSLVTRRHRSGIASRKRAAQINNSFNSAWEAVGPVRRESGPAHKRPPRFNNSRPGQRGRLYEEEPEEIPSDGVVNYFEENVRDWVFNRTTRPLLESFGLPAAHLDPLLKEFAKRVRAHEFADPALVEHYQLERFSQRLPELTLAAHCHRIYTNVFFRWAADTATQSEITKLVPESVLLTFQRLAQALDARYPEDNFVEARKIRRKIIMHVGPTNSGKTHNALRALAAARVGLYAGPLRLLAHEIWQRLNLGQIIPLGMDEPDPLAPNEAAPTSADVGDGLPAAHRNGNPAYVRACNLVTGEEQKIVDELAGLTSSTVEMISFSKHYDVAVIDEIQMIGDMHRGGGWTNAVLGLAAKEVHLCGEETAIPVIREMLKRTGDELIIKRYQRLSPLKVESRSLGGNLMKIQPGDCVITFSRRSVFALKRRIEEVTGMRCAVVYGKLPPEIRNAQAALFNDPDSGYDVMIGSDAVGMGLNLKIKRIVFETVHKFDGTRERPLSLSQTKQIAGRAGRYGLHKNSDNAGYVTALSDDAIPFLKRAVAAPFQPLPFARLNPTNEAFAKVALILPPNASTEVITDAHHYLAHVEPVYRFVQFPRLGPMSDFINAHNNSMTVAEKMMIMAAPIPWRDEPSLELIAKLVRMNRDDVRVDLKHALKDSKFLDSLDHVEDVMSQDAPGQLQAKALEMLESLHKILVLYMWMGMRHPVAWSSHEYATGLKKRAEIALEWCLQSISVNQDGRIWDPSAMRRSSEIAYMSATEYRARLASG